MPFRFKRDHYTCCLVDTRSHSKSSKSKRLHYQGTALDLKDVTCLGFSDGGVLGLLIDTESDLINTLIVSGANTYGRLDRVPDCRTINIQRTSRQSTGGSFL